MNIIVAELDKPLCCGGYGYNGKCSGEIRIDGNLILHDPVLILINYTTLLKSLHPPVTLADTSLRLEDGSQSALRLV